MPSAQLIARGVAAAAGDFVVDASWWKTLHQRASDLIDTRHHEHPEHIGLPLAQLRTVLERATAHHRVIRCARDQTSPPKASSSGRPRRSGAPAHRPTLAPALRVPGDRLRARLAAKPFEPPSRKELAPDTLSRQALRFLCDTGEAVELGAEIVLLEESFRRMKTIITRSIRSTGPATASDLRQMLGTTRRVLIPVAGTP